MHHGKKHWKASGKRAFLSDGNFLQLECINLEMYCTRSLALIRQTMWAKSTIVAERIAEKYWQKSHLPEIYNVSYFLRESTSVEAIMMYDAEAKTVSRSWGFSEGTFGFIILCRGRNITFDPFKGLPAPFAKNLSVIRPPMEFSLVPWKVLEDVSKPVNGSLCKHMEDDVLFSEHFSTVLNWQITFVFQV